MNKYILIVALFAAGCVANVNAMNTKPSAGSYQSQYHALHGHSEAEHKRMHEQKEREAHEAKAKEKKDPFASGSHSMR